MLIPSFDRDSICFAFSIEPTNLIDLLLRGKGARPSFGNLMGLDSLGSLAESLTGGSLVFPFGGLKHLLFGPFKVQYSFHLLMRQLPSLCTFL